MSCQQLSLLKVGKVPVPFKKAELFLPCSGPLMSAHVGAGVKTHKFMLAKIANVDYSFDSNY